MADVNTNPDFGVRGTACREVEYWDDFLAAGYLANTAGAGGKFDETADCGEWLVTVTDGGGDNGETITVADDLPNGYLALLVNDADNDVLSLQKNGEAFYLRAGKMLVMEAKFRITDVSETDFFFGLAITDTSILGSTLANGCTDLIGIGCPDSTGDIDYIVSKDSGGTSVDTGVNLADATDIIFRMEIDGTREARFYIDGVLVGTVTSGLPDDEALTPTIEIRNDGAVAQSMYIDYIRVAAQR